MTRTSSPGRIEMLNGVPIYFEVHGNGEPLLLLHGFSGCSQDWLQLMRGEAPGGSYSGSWGEDFRLIIPDMRGQGRSGKLTKNFRHDEAAEGMFALLDHLGILACKGVGVSAGGNVLLLDIRFAAWGFLPDVCYRIDSISEVG
jgi:pimeloyl-ACP methyl ester carboxylesterase